MAAGLIGGAALGAIASELLKRVIGVKKKISNFRPLFERLESTLKSITPRLDAINRLNHNLETEQHNLQELSELVDKGKLLVDKCSRVWNCRCKKKLRYGKELIDLDDSLKNYFIKLLPLEIFRNGLETLTLVKEMHRVIVPAPVESEAEQWREDSVYEKKVGNNLFLLKGCRYHELDLKDLESCHFKLVSTGTYSTSHWYKTKYGDVLVKRLNLEVKMQKDVFQQRMEDIGKLRHHPNIILPFGYFYSELEKFLLYDYARAPAGSLEALLIAPKDHGTRSDWKKKLEIVLGIAQGITHMHSEGGVIHGNIKSSNVLLRPGHNGCISDFGLAPMMNFSETTSRKRPRLTPKLPAPELTRTKGATKESDVYNFGVMLLEMVTTYRMKVLWHANVLKEQMQIMLIAWKCTYKDPARRPKMDQVCRLIQNTISKEDILPNP